MSSEVYIAHIGTGTLIHIDEAVLVDLGDEQEEVTSDELRSCVVVGTPLNAVIRKRYPGLFD
tara:strand:- start:68 stop:253 length:186 start_codon:yes stop_codon:yes gene_type:complete